MNTKVAKCGAHTQIDRRRISYRDSGNYSTSSIGRQLSHLLLLLLLPPVASIICSPDNKKQQRENPKQTAENRHLTVCICDRRGTCVSVCMSVCVCRGRRTQRERDRVYSVLESLRWWYSGWAVLTAPLSQRKSLFLCSCVCVAHPHSVSSRHYDSKNKKSRRGESVSHTSYSIGKPKLETDVYVVIRLWFWYQRLISLFFHTSILCSDKKKNWSMRNWGKRLTLSWYLACPIGVTQKLLTSLCVALDKHAANSPANSSVWKKAW